MITILDKKDLTDAVKLCLDMKPKQMNKSADSKSLA